MFDDTGGYTKDISDISNYPLGIQESAMENGPVIDDLS